MLKNYNLSNNKNYNLSNIKLELNKSKNVTFYFEGKKYSIFTARDGKTRLIKSFNNPKYPSAIKLTSFLYEHGIKETNHTLLPTPPSKEPISNFDASLLEPINNLPDDFINSMQLSIFREDYKNHTNIKLYKGKIVLHFTDGKLHNVRYRAYNSWRAEKGSNNIGGVLKGKNSKTLILVEGFKDGINSNIALPNCDILFIDSKNQAYNFSYVDIKKYKTIILFQDRDVRDEDFIKQFENLKDESILKIVKCVDWSRIKEGKDITDFIQSHAMTRYNTKKYLLGRIKKVLSKEPLLKKIKRAKGLKPLIKTLEHAKEKNDLPLIADTIRKMSYLTPNITEHIIYYLKQKLKTPNNAKTKYLTNGKYLTNNNIHLEIRELFKRINKIILSSPTGTGKSFMIKSLSKEYKNIIVISPLKKIAQEMGNISPFTYVRNDEKIEAVIANIKNPYIVITTDFFNSWLHSENALKSTTMLDRINETDLIIFDEQHIVEQSYNFRQSVTGTMEYLEKKHNGRVLTMSGTPIYSDLPNFYPFECRLRGIDKDTIRYYNDYFQTTQDLIENILKDIKKGSVLLYAKDTRTAKEMYNYFNNITRTLLITGKWQGVKFKNEVIEDDKKIDEIVQEDNTLIISTTKATTGANFHNLISIYQFGTAYDTNTFIQLMARLRNGGNYYYINVRNSTKNLEEIENKAIGILNIVKDYELTKASSLFNDYKIEKDIRDRIELTEYTLKQFMITYKEPLQLLESEGLIKISKNRDEIEFNQDRIKEIEPKNYFENANKYNKLKVNENLIINYLQSNNVISLLNDVYNLSFTIAVQNDIIETEKKRIITEEDLKEKEKIQDEKEREREELKEAINKKLDFLPPKAKKELFKYFTTGNLKKLVSDSRLGKKEIQEKIVLRDKNQKTDDIITRLFFFIIPKSEIVEISRNLILEKDYATLKEISDEIVQKRRIPTSKKENVYVPFLEMFFESDIPKEKLIHYSQKKINGKNIRNVITLPPQQLKELKKEKDKEKKKQIIEKEFYKIFEKIEVSENKEIEDTGVIMGIDLTKEGIRREREENIIKILESDKPAEPKIKEIKQIIKKDNGLKSFIIEILNNYIRDKEFEDDKELIRTEHYIYVLNSVKI